jgi:hypothetical protein
MTMRDSLRTGCDKAATILPAMRALLVAGCFFIGQSSAAQSVDRSDLAKLLSFDLPMADKLPGGWGGAPVGTIFLDEKMVHTGRRSVRIERRSDSPENSSTITASIPIDFGGNSIEFRGFLRTEEVSGFAGLWMREDGDSGPVAFDNMQSRQLKGTNDWAEYSINLPLKSEGKEIFFGFLMVGTGEAWADGLQLLVDGKPIWEASKVERARTVIELDHQFDGGSGIVLHHLTQAQIGNLATLGKVWGFLKYHHPKVTSGQIHWDYELMRVMPSILDNTDRAGANEALAAWIDRLGPVAPCRPCAKLDESDIQLRPETGWIEDEVCLGKNLSGRLRSVYNNRIVRQQFYISLVPGVGNPAFQHELGYSSVKLPDAGFQLLALYRFWNIIAYWFPYRDVMEEDWDKVLVEFIPRIALAKDAETYQRELMAVIARAHDGHANLWSSLAVRPPEGKCVLPLRLRFVEGSPVVAGFAAEDVGQNSEFRRGDVIKELDGQPVDALVKGWSPYYADSNDVAKLRDIAAAMTRGNCGKASVGIVRDGHNMKFKAARVSLPESSLGPATHDLPGETFRLLSKEVAYLKLSSVKAADAPHYIDRASGTKGLIIDIRNYPSEFVVFALGSLLVDRETAFARFTIGDLSNPGAFHWTQVERLDPVQPHYFGKVVILADEISLSQAEYTTMAFRVAPGAKVVGSTTSGNDGNVSPFALPGGLQALISGIGVFYPNKRPSQRIGIVPDVEVKPTIAGIRAGRDEVLEEAVRQIVGH